jgi:EAL domain-containing protein (putative c-di-GMP-specific phosphodiesterase class I)
MARGLHLDLVAEGVENRTQLEYLQQHGCEEVQGFIFSPAVPAGDLVGLLKQNSFAGVLQDKGSLVSA